MAGITQDAAAPDRDAAAGTAAESYYRAVYYGSRTSWNLRNQHMFDTLETDREGDEDRGLDTFPFGF
jgi:erythromycin esterase-like protein